MSFKHGRDCNTKTFRTTCKYCKQEVFFFSCTCGSRVFFDDLGDPWPFHRCEEYRRAQFGYYFSIASAPEPSQLDIVKQTIESIQEHLSDLKEELGRVDSSRKQLAEYIAREMMKTHPEFSDDYVSNVVSRKQAHQNPSQKNPRYEIVAQPPYKPGQREVADGLVRELMHDIDIAKRFKISSDNSMGLAFLGELGKGKFSQITIQTNMLEDNTHDSFTFVIRQSLLKKISIIKGDYIEVKLRSIQVPGNKPIWICDEIHGVFE